MKRAISDSIHSSNLKLKSDGLDNWSCGIRGGELYYYNERTGTRSSDYPRQDTPPPSPLTLEPLSPVRAKSRRMHRGAYKETVPCMDRPIPIGRPGRYGIEKTSDIVDKSDKSDIEDIEDMDGLAVRIFNQMREAVSRLNLY